MSMSRDLDAGWRSVGDSPVAPCKLRNPKGEPKISLEGVRMTAPAASDRLWQAWQVKVRTSLR